MDYYGYIYEEIKDEIPTNAIHKNFYLLKSFFLLYFLNIYYVHTGAGYIVTLIFLQLSIYNYLSRIYNIIHINTTRGILY